MIFDMDFKMGEIAEAGRILNNTIDDANKMGVVGFESMVCMLLEEYCKFNDLDVVVMAEEIATTVKNVNAEIGRY